MTLTKCPNCGHTVLSVASQCPACSGSLTSTFLGLEHQGELAECRSCGRPVRSRTAVCPHCGTPKPAGRHANPRLVLPVIAAALLAVMAVALKDRAFQPARADSTATPGTAASRETTPAAPPLDAPSAPAAPVRPAQTVSPRVPPPDSAGTPDTLPEIAAAMDSAALLAAGLQRRWTVDWSNMHRAPRNESRVVRVLPPGTEVHVAENRWGWWAILWKGDTVGYVAGALLRPTRPGR